MAGLGAVAVLGLARRGRGGARAGVLLSRSTMFAPCFYYTFLWNRLRYLWPFATGWLVGLACLARVAGDLAGAAAAALARRDAGAVRRVRGDARDEARVGAWTTSRGRRAASTGSRWPSGAGPAENLPARRAHRRQRHGAIAYFGERTTFDVVGLTTEGEAQLLGRRRGLAPRALRAAPRGSRRALPTHFIVYPEWMGLPMVLGEPLTRGDRAATRRSILGGQTMRAYIADWSKLGTGERPWTPGTGRARSTRSTWRTSRARRSTSYELLGAREGEQVAQRGGDAGRATSSSTEGATRRDEGAVRRAPAAGARGALHRAPRGLRPTVGRVLVEGQPVGGASSRRRWPTGEGAFDVPASIAGERSSIELRVSGGGSRRTTTGSSSSRSSRSRAPEHVTVRVNISG